MTHLARPSCCPKSGGKRCIPGRGETGCAFRGAKMALQPIADAAHLVHGLASCEIGSWVFRPTASSGALLHRESFCTQIGEHEVIQGGEAKLGRAVDALMERRNPPAVFVYQTCLPAMVGDDIGVVCRRAAARWERPVIPVEAPGFVGSRPYGTHVAAQALLDHVVGTREPDHGSAIDINLIGEFNMAGELDQIRPLLANLGIRVLSSLSGDGRIGDIAMSHRARAAILLCSQGMAQLAEGMRERYGIPFFHGSFHGIANTSQTLRSLAHLLIEQGGPADLPRRTESLILQMERSLLPRLEDFRTRLAGKRVLLLAGGVKSWSIAATLRSVGMTVVGTAVSKVSSEDLHRLAALGDSVPQLPNWEPEDLDALLRAGAADIVLGGSRQYPVLKAGTPWLEINHERTMALTGYAGTLRLLDAIDRAIASPVSAVVRQPAPWDDFVPATATVLPFVPPLRAVI